MGFDDVLRAIDDSRILREGRHVSPSALMRDSRARKVPWSPGDRVAVVDERGAELLAAVLAIWAGGGVPLLGASAVDLAKWRGAGALWQWPAHRLRKGTAGDLGTAFVHRTSGSTGLPKFARRSFASLLREAEGYRRCYGLRVGDRAHLAAPIEHSFAFGAAFGLMTAGAAIDLAPRFHPRRLTARLSEGMMDVVVLTPAMARLALPAAPGAPAQHPVRSVIAGAGAVSESLNAAFEDRFGVSISGNYGCSEVGATAGLPSYAGPGGIGRAFCGVSIVSPCSGDLAELVLDVGTDILGYEGAPDTGHSGHWHTRDLASIDPTGRIILHGRLDDLVKVNGRLVNLGALSLCAAAVPGVREALAFVWNRPGRPEAADLVVFGEGDALLAPAVASAIARETGNVVIVRLLEAFPRTRAGKPDRAGLLQMLGDRAPQGLEPPDDRATRQ